MASKTQAQDRLRGIRHLGVLTGVLAFVVGCGGGGSQPGGPALEGDSAVQASAGVATSTALSFSAVLNGIPGADVLGTRPDGAGGGASTLILPPLGAVQSAVFTAMTQREVTPESDGGGAAREGCPCGGTIDVSCSDDRRSSRVEASLSSCCMLDDETGLMVVGSGGLSVAVAAPGACAGSDIPDDARITVGFSNFVAAVSDDRGTRVGRLWADLTETIDPLGEGCAGPEFTLSMGGSLTTELPLEGVDVAVTAQDLRLEVTSTGFPCVVQVAVNNRMDVTDKRNGRRFSQTFDDFLLTLSNQGGNAVLATLDGAVSSDCLGKAEFMTRTPLLIVAGTRCPSDGLLEVTLGDGTHSFIAFTDLGGLEFDYDGDGFVDELVSDCREASVTECA